MSNPSLSNSLFNPQLLSDACIEAFRKLTPQQQWKNPVMFVVYLAVC